MRIKIEVEFDEKDLGHGWMNPGCLELLLYSKEFTKRNLLRILSYEEIGN